MSLCTLALGRLLLLGEGEGGGNTDPTGSSGRRHVAGEATAVQLVDRDASLVECVNVGDSKRKKGRKKKGVQQLARGLRSASLKVSTGRSGRGRKYKQ